MGTYSESDLQRGVAYPAQVWLVMAEREASRR